MKYSYQREKILDYINSMQVKHPTAENVYTAIKTDIPNISLGTVYRNLNSLVEHNLIRSVITPDNKISYDRIEHPHAHLFCKICNNTFDIKLKKIDVLTEKINEAVECNVDIEKTLLIGICSKCLEGKEEV